MRVQSYDAAELGQEKCAVSEEAAANNRVTAIAILPDKAFGDGCGIVLEIDAIGGRRPEIIMVDQGVMTESNITRDGPHQRQ